MTRPPSSPVRRWGECLKRVPGLRRCVRQSKWFLFKLLWLPRILAAVFRNLLRRDVVLYDAYGVFRRGRLLPSNWGDDLNSSFFGAVARRKMVPVPPYAHLFPFRRHLLIGSTLNWSILDHAVVYGTGVIDPRAPIRGTPARIVSVRGPLTRDVLLAHGIPCPPRYGDPALLLPLFHAPVKRPDGPVSLIPHVDTGDSPVLDALLAAGCRRIDMRAPARWTDIPDQIASSSLVLSESLHGLVVAEAYRVPCVWVEFVPHDASSLPSASTTDWSFKFRDFYASVGKPDAAPVRLFESQTLPDLDALRAAWTPAEIDFRKLLDLFPFPLAVPPRFPD